jgi:thiol-disulfide isomerase/thioredoxin
LRARAVKLRPVRADARPSGHGSRRPSRRKSDSFGSHPDVADTPGVIELTEHNFASSIDGHPFAVVDFWAPSSAPCRAFAPIFAAAAARNPDVLFAKVNTEDQQAIGAQFNIRSIPTLMIFRSNIIVCAKAGALQAARWTRCCALRERSTWSRYGARSSAWMRSRWAPPPRRPPMSTRRLQRTRALSIETYLRPSLRGPGSR